MKLAHAHFPDGLPYAEDERDFQLAASAQTRLPLADDALPSCFRSTRSRSALFADWGKPLCKLTGYPFEGWQ